MAARVGEGMPAKMVLREWCRRNFWGLEGVVGVCLLT